MPSDVILKDGKKFMWDGVDYPTGETTFEAMKKYKTDGFEVELCEEDGKSYLFTRRVVKHVPAPSA